MKRILSILLILLLTGACAQAEELSRYPAPGEDLPQLHALIVSGASKVKAIYLPVTGCEELYAALSADKICVEVQSQNLYFQRYDSMETVGGLSPCTVEDFKGWIREAFGQSEDDDLNVFCYCGHTAGMANQPDTYGAMCSDSEWYYYTEMAKDLAACRGSFVLIIDACFAQNFETKALALLDEEDRARFTLIYSSSTDTSAWVGSMTNAIGKSVQRDEDGALNADDSDSPDDGILLTELFSFVLHDTDGDGKVSYGELIGRMWNTGAASLSIASGGANWCLFQFSSVEIEESSVTIGSSAGTEATQLHTALKNINSDAEHTVYWQSENEAVVTVDASGKLTAVAPGQTTVTAFLRDPYGNPCIGSADTCEVTVQGTELQFYGLETTDEWGSACTEVHMRSVDTATFGVLADVTVGSVNSTLIGERFVAYELENGDVYCELSGMLDGVSIDYSLYRLEDGIPTLVQRAHDPGYTSAVGLYDGQTNAEILCYEGVSGWQDAEDEYRAALEDALSASNLRFDQVATIHSRDLRYAREYVSADLSDAKLLICAESRDELPTLLEQSGMGTLTNDELTTIAPVAGVSGAEDEQDAAAGNIVTTGDVNVRTGPGLSYDSIGVVSKGGKLSYLGETSTDERGVDWYKVSYASGEGWVSSKYAALTD